MGSGEADSMGKRVYISVVLLRPKGMQRTVSLMPERRSRRRSSQISFKRDSSKSEGSNISAKPLMA
jgi:hypothetical protein